MPKVPWSEFVIDSSTGHLVAGIVSGDNPPNLLSRLVASLVKHLEPKGEYALTVYRGTGTVEIHCAFRQQADADSFAASVQAVALGTHPGWVSQRTFILDVAAAHRIERTRDDLLRAQGMKPRRR
jgi:hypothetical protein